ncbi:MAG: 3-hydroxyisobutyrate dehydrogenase, partial [Tagaea sp. CACIAM 22H2]|nr:3-hydroxyisobutyrate dehydrogenase [Tagaea sp. CACIAM 22H2]
MATIAFIGLGNMGGPMAGNLAKAGETVRGFDLAKANLDAAMANGVAAVSSIADAVNGAEIVVTMLPAGPQSRAVYDAVIPVAEKGALLIDCSTIDVDSARAITTKASAAGFEMVDAPVSGGTVGAANATLTFMVGGGDAAFARAQPILSKMGKTIVHAGGPGNGQAA